MLGGMNLLSVIIIIGVFVVCFIFFIVTAGRSTFLDKPLHPLKLLFVLFPIISIAVICLAASKEGASKQAFVEALAVAIAIVLGIGGAYAILHWLRPKWLLRFSAFVQIQNKTCEPFAKADETNSGGWIVGILALLVTFAVSKWAFALLEYLVICYLYGHTAWADGLRVTDKRGDLSNGDYLTGWSYITLYLGTCAFSVILGAGSFLLFGYIRFRLQGRRLSDPKPKKKWRSSGKSDHDA
jgi:hypothetical protein